MFLTIFFKTQNIEETMHLTMLIAHPNGRVISNISVVLQMYVQFNPQWTCINMHNFWEKRKNATLQRPTRLNNKNKSSSTIWPTWKTFNPTTRLRNSSSPSQKMDPFSSSCISQTWSIGFPQSYWQSFWLPEFDITFWIFWIFLRGSHGQNQEARRAATLKSGPGGSLDF